MSDLVTPGTGVSRRGFVVGTTLAAMGAAAFPALGHLGVHAGAGRMKVGVIGCGGRGTGAAANILEASPDVEIWALADVLPERVASCKSGLAGLDTEYAARAGVLEERCYSGFDAYQRLLEHKEIDIVILATPPGFRPMQFEAAVKAGKHIFVEKPVGVDPVGLRRVMAAGEVAKSKGLCVVAGTQRRHETCYLDAMKRLEEQQIGRLVSASCYWNQGGLWMNPRQPEWSDVEWQLRNWLYFTWLSGDHIVEQHVHNLDVINWAAGSHPVSCWAMGGRQSRTSAAYGQIHDHFAVQYEYPDGFNMTSFCRQIDGCDSRVEEVVRGTDGIMVTSSGRAEFRGGKPWKFSGRNNNPYVQEHVDLIAAITSGKTINEAQQVAESTMTAVMGRMAAYTGKTVTWEHMMKSDLDLMPSKLAFGPMAVDAVAMPGKTPLV